MVPGSDSIEHIHCFPVSGAGHRTTAGSDQRLRNRETRKLPAASISLGIVCLTFFSYAAAEGNTIAEGVYTEAQAQSGEELYRVNCLTCHDKKYFRPVLERWNGQTLGILYTIMSTSMPESNPGALRQEEYVEILAYILSLSRYPAGTSELDYRDGALEKITVAPRKR
jgi:mono/diheme cytochrome c family protein